jgi:phospholipid/cholesterol/gamma-HCH transport system substrate-binding protein
MSRNVIETVMGAVVLVIAAVFLFFAYSTSQVHSVSGYTLTAKFNKIDGIRDGGDVRISGIKVGSILSLTLDPTNYLAIVKMSLDPTVKVPSDSVAEILSNGLLGDKFLALVPGAADDSLKPGAEIKFTQAPMGLEDIIGQYIFSQGNQKSGAAGAAPAAPAAAPTSPGGLPSLTAPTPAPAGAAASAKETDGAGAATK